MQMSVDGRHLARRRLKSVAPSRARLRHRRPALCIGVDSRWPERHAHARVVHSPGMIKFRKPVSVDVEVRLPCLAETLARDDHVAAVWLFGSRARKEADALSDVDIAVLARGGLDRSALWDDQLRWTRVAVEVLGTDEVAIQIVNPLPVALRHGILHGARLLWARSPEIAADFETRTLKEYLDFKPYLDRYDRDLFDEAARGTLR